VSEQKSADWQVKKDKIDTILRVVDLERDNGKRPGTQKIGNIYRYDHKISSVAGIFFSSMAIISQQSVYSYLYILVMIKILKDTFKTGIASDKEFYFSKLRMKPLIYYLAAASIIVVAALTSNHVIPGIEGGTVHYVSGAFP